MNTYSMSSENVILLIPFTKFLLLGFYIIYNPIYKMTENHVILILCFSRPPLHGSVHVTSSHKSEN